MRKSRPGYLGDLGDVWFKVSKPRRSVRSYSFGDAATKNLIGLPSDCSGLVGTQLADCIILASKGRRSSSRPN